MTTTRLDKQNYLDSLDNDEEESLETNGENMNQLPISLSYRNTLVAHYADGSAVPLSQMEPDDRNAVLAEMVERYNSGGDATDESLRSTCYGLLERLEPHEPEEWVSAQREMVERL